MTVKNAPLSPGFPLDGFIHAVIIGDLWGGFYVKSWHRYAGEAVREAEREGGFYFNITSEFGAASVETLVTYVPRPLAALCDYLSGREALSASEWFKLFFAAQDRTAILAKVWAHLAAAQIVEGFMLLESSLRAMNLYEMVWYHCGPVARRVRELCTDPDGYGFTSLGNYPPDADPAEVAKVQSLLALTASAIAVMVAPVSADSKPIYDEFAVKVCKTAELLDPANGITRLARMLTDIMHNAEQEYPGLESVAELADLLMISRQLSQEDAATIVASMLGLAGASGQMNRGPAVILAFWSGQRTFYPHLDSIEFEVPPEDDHSDL